MATSALSETQKATKKESSQITAKQLIAAAVLLLAGAGGGYWLGRAGTRLRGGFFAHAAAASPGGEAPLDYVALDPFLVNLAAGQGYLKLAMTLGIDPSAEPSAEPGARHSSAKTPQDLARSALVRDTILEALSSQNADELLTAEGKSELKKALKSALKATAPDLPLDRIYFTDFLVQR